MSPGAYHYVQPLLATIQFQRGYIPLPKETLGKVEREPVGRRRNIQRHATRRVLHI
jgi:hypothetical protein